MPQKKTVEKSYSKKDTDKGGDKKFMPDQELTIGVNVVNLDEIKELRKELERIKELKEEIKEMQEEEKTEPGVTPSDVPDIDPNPNPRPFPEPEYPQRPRFWVSLDSEGEVTEFDPFENDEDDIKAETSFEV